MNSGINSRALLIILDGWGINQDPNISAIEAANTPFYDSLCKKYANATLITYGEDVGLPDGQMGNSEVGHLNIGAGRVVYQELARINKAIRTGEFAANKQLTDLLDRVQQNGGDLHLMGLVSNGGVHSHINHLKALCDTADARNISTFIHAFTDGRDVGPNTGLSFIEELQEHIAGTSVKLASLVGRYYAMDRDKRWERTKKAYDLLVRGEGEASSDIIDSIRKSYQAEITDEFIEPIVAVTDEGTPVAQIKDGDAVIFFNFRTDRPRQLVTVLTQENLDGEGMHTLELDLLTMTAYDDTYRKLHVMFESNNLKKTLGQVLSEEGKSQVRIAETEKYPHVTFFFSGGREEPFDAERRIMVPSPKVATYDLQPEMSALEVTDLLMNDIKANTPDFICLNYANTDMVGHTGVFSAAVRAAETVDDCLSRLVPLAQAHDYGIVIIADHGNSDIMLNPDGSVHTAHTTNPVGVVLVSDNAEGIEVADGRLADIAPTVLDILGLKQPVDMTGKTLLTGKR